MRPRINTAVHLLALTVRYFGVRKALRFVVFLPLAAYRKSSTAAFEKMGHCKTMVGSTEIQWVVANPSFIEEIIEKKSYTPSDVFEVGPNFLVVDGGANIGTFAIYAASRATNVRVIAIEANSALVDLLRRNAEANSHLNIEILNAALGPVDGKVRFYCIPSGGSLSKDYDHTARALEIQEVSIESVLARFGLAEIDLLKLDIEGGEFELLRHPESLAKVKRLVMEIHKGSTSAEMVSIKLRTLGFSCYTKIGSVPGHPVYIYATRKESA